MSCDAVNDVIDEVADSQDGAMNEFDWPSEITINRKSRTLELRWADAHVSISHRVLRRSCRCSGCESTRRKLNDVMPVPSEVELKKVELLGTTGMQLFFSDDHNRGIYPWAYLRQIGRGRVKTGYTEALMKGWRDE